MPEAGANDDLQALFQMGRAAYYKGDMEMAYQLLKQVEAKQPNHYETKVLLAQIRTHMKTGTGSLKKTYSGVTLAKIEFVDVSLEEAVEGLRGLCKTSTEGKVMPNIIIKDAELKAKTLSLQLNNIPLTEAIEYIARVAGARAVYEQHAVMLVSLAGSGTP
ncbi:MAG TPA: hypothetical protein DIT64_05670 [Verrucomicrobiales bacterium]|nr:hypothetical protein [Verrucomicrobiales bacterium]HCN79205.1 hypothetical protein [Verrucomicrobiales bacterium]